MDRNPLARYLIKSRHLLSGVVFTIPLYIVYELGVISLGTADIPSLRNGADVLMRQILESFGLKGYHGIGLSYILLVIILVIYHRRSLKETLTAGNIFFFMFLESMLWAVVLYGALLASQILLSTGVGPRLIQQVVLAAGAGLYEELVFRVFLIHGISKILKFIFKWEKQARLTGSILVAAILFSGFHFLGPYGDLPGYTLFVTRLAAGIFLGTIYVFRGFGITAYAHSIYDLIVLTQFHQLN